MQKNKLIVLLIMTNLALIAGMVFREFRGEKFARVSSSAIAAAVAPAPTSTKERRTEIVAAAEKVAPAVVSVGAWNTGYLMHPFAQFFSDFAAYPYREKIPYLGSGVVVDPNGLIVTNHHVIENAKDIFVTLTDGREVSAKVLDADTALDVALLKVDAKNLVSAKIGDSNNLLVGEWALAMGNPFGNLIGDPTPTVTLGVISALKRSFRPNQEMSRVYMDMIQTDAAINPGNSGGALINAAGELIGINTFIMSRSGGAEGIGFAIPVNRVKAVIEEILLHGKIRPRVMDFRVQNLTPSVAEMLGSSEGKGAVISEIAQSGPAEKAGFHRYDIVTKVDQRPVKDAQDFALYVWTQQVGTKVLCEVERKGKKLELTYELTEAAR